MSDLLIPGDRVYSTKYALSSGISLETVKSHDDRYPAYVYVEMNGNFGIGRQLAGEGRDWHRTKESAVSRARAMRDAKIKSLRKQIAKLEAMQFD